jgi:hypothetical protein
MQRGAIARGSHKRKAEEQQVSTACTSVFFLSIPKDVLVHLIWTRLNFNEKLSSRLVCRQLRVVGALSISRFPKRHDFCSQETVPPEAFLAFPRLEVVETAARCIPRVVHILGPRVRAIKRLTTMCGNGNSVCVVEGRLLQNFCSLTSFCCNSELDEVAFAWLRTIGPNVKSLSLRFEDMMQILACMPSVETLGIETLCGSERLHDPDVLLDGLAKNCLRLRKLKARVEFASMDVLEFFLSRCTRLEAVNIFPLCTSVLLSKLPLLPQLRTLCGDNSLTGADSLVKRNLLAWTATRATLVLSSGLGSPPALCFGAPAAARVLSDPSLFSHSFLELTHVVEKKKNVLRRSALCDSSHKPTRQRKLFPPCRKKVSKRRENDGVSTWRQHLAERAAKRGRNSEHKQKKKQEKREAQNTDAIAILHPNKMPSPSNEKCSFIGQFEHTASPLHSTSASILTAQ